MSSIQATSHDSTVAGSGGLTLAATKRWSVAQYEQMMDVGLLSESEPYELIRGLLVRKMTKGPRHELVVESLRDFLVPRLPKKWICRSQGPIRLPDGVPEPDLSLAVGPRTRYATRHPKPEEVALVIEVAEHSLALDRGLKLESYAQGGIVEYWIIDIQARAIEVYSEPKETNGAWAYEQKRIYRRGAQAPVKIEGQMVGEISAAELLAAK